MHLKDADRIANSVDPDQTALGAVWSGSALFAQNYLSKNSGSLWYLRNRRKIWSPKKIAEIIQKFEQYGFTMQLYIQKMQMQWQTLQTPIRLLRRQPIQVKWLTSSFRYMSSSAAISLIPWQYPTSELYIE